MTLKTGQVLCLYDSHGVTLISSPTEVSNGYPEGNRAAKGTLQFFLHSTGAVSSTNGTVQLRLQSVIVNFVVSTL